MIIGNISLQTENKLNFLFCNPSVAFDFLVAEAKILVYLYSAVLNITHQPGLVTPLTLRSYPEHILKQLILT